MKGLLWFRQDLRLSDNPALVSLSKQCQQAIMLFIIDPQWFKKNEFQSTQLGNFREIFLYQSLKELDAELKQYNQHLVIKVGDPLVIIPALCKKHGIDYVTFTQHVGGKAQHQTDHLAKKLLGKVQICQSHTLFFESQLRLNRENFPRSFHAFREHVTCNNLLPCIPISIPDSLPTAMNEANDYWRNEHFHQLLGFYQGGEAAAMMRLKTFFWNTPGLQQFHQSRTDIEGLQSTSRFSAWLANGCLSVRSIAAELDKYEYRYGDEGASKILYQRLMYREYYQWRFALFGQSLFKSYGSNKPCLTEHEATAYKLWQQAKTPYPLVNACMKQLNNMGYLSYLGRNLVASCLIDELNIDWRYGAAYFQQQLIDHDIAINYGSWQTLAEKGRTVMDFYADLEQYSQEYDPDGIFVMRWSKLTDKISLR